VNTDNWVTIAGFTTAGSLVAIGWFVTGYLNRSKDVALKRMEYRLAALQSCLPILFATGAPFAQPGFAEQLADVRSKLQLYGFNDEIDGMERFISAVERCDLQGANNALNDLKPLVRTHIRRELNLDT
jgi:hypothetical protein